MSKKQVVAEPSETMSGEDYQEARVPLVETPEVETPEVEETKIYTPAVLPNGKLLIDAWTLDPEATYELTLDQINVNPLDNQRRRPRKITDKDIRDNAADILQNGVLQNLGVRLDDAGAVHLVWGFGRMLSIELANQSRMEDRQILVPVKVYAVDALKARQLNIIENIKRKSLTPIDIADYIAAREKEGVTDASIAKELDMKPPSISAYKKMLNFPIKVQTYIDSGKISYGAALQLLTLPSNVVENAADELVAAAEPGRPVTRTSAEAKARSQADPAAQGRKARSMPALKALLGSVDAFSGDSSVSMAVAKFMLDTIAGKGNDAGFSSRLDAVITKSLDKAKGRKAA